MNSKSSNAEVTFQLVLELLENFFLMSVYFQCAPRQTSLPTASLLGTFSFKKSAESLETKANAERGAPKETREPKLL